LGLLAGIFVKPITGSYPGVLSGYLVNRRSPGTLSVFRVTRHLSCSDPDDRKKWTVTVVPFLLYGRWRA